MQQSNENPGRKFDLEDRLVDFAINVLDLVESLPKQERLCTWEGNCFGREPRQPSSMGKLKVPNRVKTLFTSSRLLKELRESSICLRIMDKRSLLKNHEVLNESKELVAIFTKSVKTAESK